MEEFLYILFPKFLIHDKQKSIAIWITDVTSIIQLFWSSSTLTLALHESMIFNCPHMESLHMIFLLKTINLTSDFTWKIICKAVSSSVYFPLYLMKTGIQQNQPSQENGLAEDNHVGESMRWLRQLDRDSWEHSSRNRGDKVIWSNRDAVQGCFQLLWQGGGSLLLHVLHPNLFIYE